MSNLTIVKDLAIVTVKAAIIATLVFALTTMLITQAHAYVPKQGDPNIDPPATAGSDARIGKPGTSEIIIHEAPKHLKIVNHHGNDFDIVGETE